MKIALMLLLTKAKLMHMRKSVDVRDVALQPPTERQDLFGLMIAVRRRRKNETCRPPLPDTPAREPVDEGHRT